MKKMTKLLLFIFISLVTQSLCAQNKEVRNIKPIEVPLEKTQEEEDESEEDIVIPSNLSLKELVEIIKKKTPFYLPHGFSFDGAMARGNTLIVSFSKFRSDKFTVTENWDTEAFPEFFINYLNINGYLDMLQDQNISIDFCSTDGKFERTIAGLELNTLSKNYKYFLARNEDHEKILKFIQRTARDEPSPYQVDNGVDVTHISYVSDSLVQFFIVVDSAEVALKGKVASLLWIEKNDELLALLQYLKSENHRTRVVLTNNRMKPHFDLLVDLKKKGDVTNAYVDHMKIAVKLTKKTVPIDMGGDFYLRDIDIEDENTILFEFTIPMQSIATENVELMQNAMIVNCFGIGSISESIQNLRMNIKMRAYNPDGELLISLDMPYQKLEERFN